LEELRDPSVRVSTPTKKKRRRKKKKRREKEEKKENLQSIFTDSMLLIASMLAVTSKFAADAPKVTRSNPV
jgi:hypothetical protein